jgi:hypothetical protein
MRTLIVLVCLCGLLEADVLVLKDGRKLAGKVVEKPSFYEVTGDGGLKTFLKDEVERVITAPKELLGDADTVLEDVKKDFQKALEIAPGDEQNAKLKAAIAKLSKAREAYSSTRESFPEDKYADLDQKLLQVMQLMRLLRERVRHEGIVSAPPIAPSPAPAPAPTTPAPAPKPVTPAPAPIAPSVLEALLVAADPAKRKDPGQRAVAKDALRASRDDVATAAMLFLSRPETDWRLEGPALAALQEYFSKGWIKDPQKLPAATQLEAAKWLADRIAALKKSDPNASSEALATFAMGHLAQSPPGAESAKVAQALGFIVKEGIAGTPEGHAVQDLDGWILSGDFDLAALAYVKELRATSDTPIVRFLWSYALIRQAQQKKRGFERPIGALDNVRPAEPAARDHVAALAKSVKNVAVCSTCGGEGKTRCTACHGKKEVRNDCTVCKGVGATRGAGGLAPCTACQGRGYLKLVRCDKCKDGYPECRQCDRRPRTPPELEDMFMAAPCPLCEGRGLAFRRFFVPCRSCLGLGQKLTPRADPTKILP